MVTIPFANSVPAADPLPAEWRREIGLQAPEAAPLAMLGWVELDLDARLQFRRGLLVMTPSQVWFLAAGGNEPVSIPLGADSRLELADHGGVGTLQLCTDRGLVASWRFTLARMAAVQRFAEAQNRLSAAIVPLQRLQEAYPDLKSQANFTTLMSQLEGTENRIAVSIRDYNEAVQAYNTRIRTFPDMIGAKLVHGAKPLVPFEATTPNADVAPTVDFGK